MLKNYFNTKIANQKKISGVKISSSQIRKLIQAGKISKANRLLGRSWSVIGNVNSGNKIGRKLGYKTANLFINNCIQPYRGVYATKLYFKIDI